jgi:SAM-dependent methyltransferase
MPSESNAEQAAFWNEGPGLSWVDCQAELDALQGELTRRLIDACAARRGERALDVGCGAGETTLALAERVGPTGSVAGIDISGPLLDRAEARRAARGAANVRFIRADAQDHPFPPEGFDLVASRLGVMFFADPAAAFANLAAAMRPGGRLAFVAWAGAEANPWFAVPARIATARLGPVAPVPPHAPGPMAFADVDRTLGILRAAGLDDARAEVHDVALLHTGGPAAAAALAGRIGPTARAMREKGGTEADLTAIRAAIADAFAGYADADGLRVPARVNLFSARRR